jgi:hypothetical protein
VRRKGAPRVQVALLPQSNRKDIAMTDLSQIEKDAEVIGADGVHVGTVDHVAHGRIKLTKKDSSDGHHHYIDGGLIASIEDGVVRLSATGENAVFLED